MDVTNLEDSELDGEDIKKAKDPLSMPQGPLIKSRFKKLQEALIGYVQEWATNKESHVRVAINGKATEGVLTLFNVLQV